MNSGKIREDLKARRRNRQSQTFAWLLIKKNIFKTVQSLDLGLRGYFGTDKSYD